MEVAIAAKLSYVVTAEDPFFESPGTNDVDMYICSSAEQQDDS